MKDNMTTTAVSDSMSIDTIREQIAGVIPGMRLPKGKPYGIVKLGRYQNCVFNISKNTVKVSAVTEKCPINWANWTKTYIEDHLNDLFKNQVVGDTILRFGFTIGKRNPSWGRFEISFDRPDDKELIDLVAELVIGVVSQFEKNSSVFYSDVLNTEPKTQPEKAEETKAETSDDESRIQERHSTDFVTLSSV